MPSPQCGASIFPVHLSANSSLTAAPLLILTHPLLKMKLGSSPLEPLGKALVNLTVTSLISALLGTQVAARGPCHRVSLLSVILSSWHTFLLLPVAGTWQARPLGTYGAVWMPSEQRSHLQRTGVGCGADFHCRRVMLMGGLCS